MGEMLQVAVFGASGYSGAELVRLLAQHPSAELSLATAGESTTFTPTLVKCVGKQRFMTSEMRWMPSSPDEL